MNEKIAFYIMMRWLFHTITLTLIPSQLIRKKEITIPAWRLDPVISINVQDFAFRIGHHHKERLILTDICWSRSISTKTTVNKFYSHNLLWNRSLGRYQLVLANLSLYQPRSSNFSFIAPTYSEIGAVINVNWYWLVQVDIDQDHPISVS